MKIVHYTLGLYPQRTGGLNRYATDLMMEQAKKYEVMVITPGPWRPWSKKVTIKDKGDKGQLRYYQLYNALPLPLLYGIKEPHFFVNRDIDKRSFEFFIKSVKPDVLHLHTLMGMPEAALSFFKENGVKIVYTSHDYFGICPKVNLINQEGLLCEGPNPYRCAICNMNAPSTLYLRLRNSRLAFVIRDLSRWLKHTLNF